MNSPELLEKTDPDSDHRRWIWVALFFLAVALAATSNQSFWIDEFCTAKAARNPSLLGTWLDLVRNRPSELQMPFFIAYVWAYKKVFGGGELALRLSALPFFVSGMTLLVVATARRWRQHWPVAAALGLSPFAWYYLNEARPYALQLGATAMIVAALTRLSETAPIERKTEGRWLGVYLLGVSLLSTSNLLGEMWAGAALLAVFVAVPKPRWSAWWTTYRWRLLCTGAVLLSVGCYYLWTLQIGARATAIATTNLQTFLFIFYEQLGFVGPGPGRNELREIGVQALKPFAAGLAVHGLVTGLVMMAGLAALWKQVSCRRLFLLLACVAVPAGLILLAGVVTHFRVLGRHFVPLTVLFLLIIGAGLLRLWAHQGWLRRGIAVCFLVLSLVSCVQVRVAERHTKEDYRQAAAIAKAALARGEIVWWNAADIGADYYHLPISTNSSPTEAALLVFDPRPGFDASLPPPDLIAVSKPDIYDRQGVLAAYLQKHRYQKVASFMAFSVWRKQTHS